MKTNLNMLFQDQIVNFAHILTTSKQTKNEFMSKVKQTYDAGNRKTDLFMASCERSTFNTIRLNDRRDSILFNQ